MIVLALDTSHPLGSVALRHSSGEAIATEFFGQDDSHLQGVARMTDRLLAQAGIAPRDLDRIALVKGPGSFTGLRIGMAFAKGLAGAVGADMVAVGTLDLLATPHLSRRLGVAVMIDARKGEVYSAYYRRLDRTTGLAQPESGPVVAAPDLFLASLPSGPTVFIGSGARRYRTLIEDQLGGGVLVPDGGHRPSTAELAKLAPSLPPLAPEEVLKLEPLYLRPSDAELKKLRGVGGSG